MMKKMIELINVDVSFKKRLFFNRKTYQALKSVNLVIHQGETVGIIGRNGAGKSTLLKLMAGILKPDQGEIKFHTNSIHLLSLKLGFSGELTGIENLYISGMLMGMRRKELKQKEQEIIKFAELEYAIEEPLKTYSTGMRTRLGFSIAHSAKSEILLVDEALGVGDQPFKTKCMDEMRRRSVSRQTIIIVSHTWSELAQLCDRLVWIEDCTIKAQGPPGALKDSFFSL